jgi:hypothetical protein
MCLVTDQEKWLTNHPSPFLMYFSQIKSVKLRKNFFDYKEFFFL